MAGKKMMPKRKPGSLRKACKEKQNSQTIEEQTAPYGQLIKNIKNEPAEPIYKIERTKEVISELIINYD